MKSFSAFLIGGTSSGAGKTGTGYGSGPSGAFAVNSDGYVAQPSIVIVWEYK